MKYLMRHWRLELARWIRQVPKRERRGRLELAREHFPAVFGVHP